MLRCYVPKKFGEDALRATVKPMHGPGLCIPAPYDEVHAAVLRSGRVKETGP